MRSQWVHLDVHRRVLAGSVVTSELVRACVLRTQCSADSDGVQCSRAVRAVVADIVSGHRKLLPCGHVGEAVIGQFYRCLRRGCDGREPSGPDYEDDDYGDRGQCPKCSSSNTAPFAMTGGVASHCWDCGAVY